MTPLRKELLAEIETVASRDADLIRSIADTSIPLKHSSWTVGDVVAHLVISQRVTKNILRGEKNPYPNVDPQAIASTNEKLLSEFPERNGKTLATLLAMDTDAFIKEANRYDDDHTMVTHFGSLNLLTGLSHNLFHLLLHGCQIADTLQRALPIEAKHLPLILPFLKKSMIATYDKESAVDFNGTFIIHLRNSLTFGIVCDGENIQITDDVLADVDCHISLDPISYFLLLAGVVSQWKLFMTGKISIWGKKPWFALHLPKLFRNP
jgi:hypothetical protein